MISQGPGTASVGLKVDRHGRLFVAGGPSGTGRVVSVRGGKILATYTFVANPGQANPTFVNDVVLTRKAAWFTDSQRAELYRVPLGHKGRVAGQSRVKAVPLSGDWQQVAGFNANGIAETPDRRALLVVQSQTGYLFKVNKRTGKALRVDLGSALLSNGDGLLVRGRTLYAVQNQLNQVAVVKLNRSGSRGELVGTLTSPDFDVPTTVAAYKNWCYLPNARFGIENPETAEYSINRVKGC